MPNYKEIKRRRFAAIRSLRLLPHSEFVPSTRFPVACHSVYRHSLSGVK